MIQHGQAVDQGLGRPATTAEELRILWQNSPLPPWLVVGDNDDFLITTFTAFVWRDRLAFGLNEAGLEAIQRRHARKVGLSPEGSEWWGGATYECWRTGRSESIPVEPDALDGVIFHLADTAPSSRLSFLNPVRGNLVATTAIQSKSRFWVQVPGVVVADVQQHWFVNHWQALASNPVRSF